MEGVEEIPLKSLSLMELILEKDRLEVAMEGKTGDEFAQLDSRWILVTEEIQSRPEAD